MSEQEHPDWDAELEELVKDVETEADLASVDMSEGEARPSAGEPPQNRDLMELLSERTADLQRLQAEYVNYKRRVDRDRDQARQRGIEAVLTDLLPVFDGIDAAQAHDELTGGAKMLADELARVTAKYGMTSFGQDGDPFDPHIHDALMHIDKPGYATTSVAEVFQRGYKVADRVIRPARVGVADADPNVEQGEREVEGGGSDSAPSCCSDGSHDANDPHRSHGECCSANPSTAESHGGEGQGPVHTPDDDAEESTAE